MASIAPERLAQDGGARRSALLTGAGELLVTAGVLVLLFVAWQVWWTDLGALRRAEAITDRTRSAWAAAGTARPGTSGSEGVVLAVLHVPRFGRDWQRPVLEGTAPRELDQGVGHYRGTALPGQVGNVAIAGHRTTYGRPFRNIDRLVIGDAIVVETATGWYTYRVTGHRVVAPRESEVVAGNPDDPAAAPVRAMLTLTSCHPVYSAERRWVVHAVLDTIRVR
ncbi:MAG: class E sortase [Kineosporiaceae bacterium]